MSSHLKSIKLNTRIKLTQWGNNNHLKIYTKTNVRKKKFTKLSLSLLYSEQQKTWRGVRPPSPAPPAVTGRGPSLPPWTRRDVMSRPRCHPKPQKGEQENQRTPAGNTTSPATATRPLGLKMPDSSIPASTITDGKHKHKPDNKNIYKQNSAINTSCKMHSLLKTKNPKYNELN